AFRWPMKAKLNGAKLVHVDPRFTRTSAVADLHVPIRAGSDIAFLGGLINYVVNSKRWNTDPFFKEFAVNYTNAATIIGDDFKDTEDLDGVFSGMVKFTEPAFWPYNGLEGRYDNATWAYKRGPKAPGPVTKDLIAKRAGPPFDDLVRAAAAATGQHRSARRRCDGAARPCGDPGLDRRADPVPQHSRVHERPVGAAAARDTAGLHGGRDQPHELLRPPAQVPRLVLPVDVRRRRDGGERFRLRLAPEDPGR